MRKLLPVLTIALLVGCTTVPTNPSAHDQKQERQRVTSVENTYRQRFLPVCKPEELAKKYNQGFHVVTCKNGVFKIENGSVTKVR